jgi:hypothetical protein
MLNVGAKSECVVAQIYATRSHFKEKRETREVHAASTVSSVRSGLIIDSQTYPSDPAPLGAASLIVKALILIYHGTNVAPLELAESH